MEKGFVPTLHLGSPLFSLSSYFSPLSRRAVPSSRKERIRMPCLATLRALMSISQGKCTQEREKGAERRVCDREQHFSLVLSSLSRTLNIGIARLRWRCKGCGWPGLCFDAGARRLARHGKEASAMNEEKGATQGLRARSEVGQGRRRERKGKESGVCARGRRSESHARGAKGRERELRGAV